MKTTPKESYSNKASNAITYEGHTFNSTSVSTAEGKGMVRHKRYPKKARLPRIITYQQYCANELFIARQHIISEMNSNKPCSKKTNNSLNKTLCRFFRVRSDKTAEY